RNTTGYANYADSTANGGVGWLPGGSMGGITIDGKGFSIVDVNIKRSNNSQNGLFYYLDNATIKNLTVRDFQIEGSGYTGFFAGYVENVIFDNVHAINGIVKSKNYYGGLLAGRGYNVTLTNSSVQGRVTGNYYMGGFLGEMYYGKIENSYANVEISGLQNLGGLVGVFENNNTNAAIVQSFVTG